MKTFNITDALGTTLEIEYSVTFELDGKEYNAWGVCSSGSNTKNLDDLETGEPVETDKIDHGQWEEIFHQAWLNIEE